MRCVICDKKQNLQPFPLLLTKLRENAAKLCLSGPSVGNWAHPECLIKYNAKIAKLMKKRGFMMEKV